MSRALRAVPSAVRLAGASKPRSIGQINRRFLSAATHKARFQAPFLAPTSAIHSYKQQWRMVGEIRPPQTTAVPTMGDV